MVFIARECEVLRSMRGALLIILCVAGSSLAQEDGAADAGRGSEEIVLDAGVDTLTPTLSRGEREGILQGVVEARGTRTPIPLAQVLFADGGVLTESDADGRFSATI